jgi:hypothetical protein
MAIDPDGATVDDIGKDVVTRARTVDAARRARARSVDKAAS